MTKLGTSLCALLVTFVASPVTYASVVTSGYISVTSYALGSGSFSLSGEGFRLDGFIYGGVWDPRIGVEGRAFTGADFVTVTTDIGHGSATTWGTDYSLTVPVAWGSMFAERGSFLSIDSVDINPVVFSNDVTTYQQAFSFTGSLCGVTLPIISLNDPCVADFPSLSGTGVAEYEYYQTSYSDAGNILLFPRSAMYRFADPVSVSEPSALGLLGFSLFGVLAAYRKRQSGRRSSQAVY